MNTDAAALSPILVADDDEQDLHLFRRRLLAAGIKNAVVTFSEGGVLLDFLKATRSVTAHEHALHPCLLFLDVRMPEPTGFDVLTWIRHQNALKNMMVVMMSGVDEPSDSERATELGANHYLVKFPPAKVLIEIVNHACGTQLVAAS